MEILFVATELAPYAKVGGLADVAAALPKSLRNLGHRITLVLPKYANFEESGLLFARRLSPLRFEFGGREVEAMLYDARLPSQLELTVIEIGQSFSRPGIYAEEGEDYGDNAERFALFSRAVAELAAARARAGTPFDIVHANDWPTALTMLFLKELREKEETLANTKLVFTVHNAAYQGLTERSHLAALGLEERHLTIDGIEFFGKLNLLKQGLLAADATTTVSSNYARDLEKEAQGLEGVIRSLPRPILGITSGVDYAVWNPATDPYLPSHFSAEDAGGKRRARGLLLRDLGIPLEFEGPIVFHLGRFVPEKGQDLIAQSLGTLLRSTEAHFIIGGDGDAKIREKLEAAAGASNGRARVLVNPSESLVHRLFAGSDLFLAPSRIEPCGLTQQYAQRYGTLPVARAIGGMIDTIVDCDNDLETGTGFLFDRDEDFIGAVQRGVAALSHQRLPNLLRRVMRLERGWERPGRRYESLYRSLGARTARVSA